MLSPFHFLLSEGVGGGVGEGTLEGGRRGRERQRGKGNGEKHHVNMLWVWDEKYGYIDGENYPKMDHRKKRMPSANSYAFSARAVTAAE